MAELKTKVNKANVDKFLHSIKVVSTKGSWEAGIDGALPGIIMQANPQVGDPYGRSTTPARPKTWVRCSA